MSASGWGGELPPVRNINSLFLFKKTLKIQSKFKHKLLMAQNFADMSATKMFFFLFFFIARSICFKSCRVRAVFAYIPCPQPIFFFFFFLNTFPNGPLEENYYSHGYKNMNSSEFTQKLLSLYNFCDMMLLARFSRKVYLRNACLEKGSDQLLWHYIIHYLSVPLYADSSPFRGTDCIAQRFADNRERFKAIFKLKLRHLIFKS